MGFGPVSQVVPLSLLVLGLSLLCSFLYISYTTCPRFIALPLAAAHRPPARSERHVIAVAALGIANEPAAAWFDPLSATATAAPHAQFVTVAAVAGKVMVKTVAFDVPFVLWRTFTVHIFPSILNL